MPSIGEKIKKLRLAKKMTQEMLARQLNVTVSAVSQWESGKTMPDLSGRLGRRPARHPHRRAGENCA